MAELQPDEKVCPFCAETIKAAAIRCRYCHSDLSSTGSGPDPERDPDPGPPPPPPAPAAQQGAAAPTPTATAVDREEHGGPAIPFWASFRLLRILVVVCLVLAVLLGLVWWRGEHPAEGQAPDGAITSAEARDAGMQAATRLTQKVLSYDWKTLDADMRSAEAVLAPSFRTQYRTTMAKVKSQTVKNQVRLTASVVATSIVSATEDKVVALVFVNQVTTAKGSGNQRLDQNRVLVTLGRDGGEWRVSKMDAF